MPSEPNSCAWRAPNQTVEAEEALVPVAGTLDEASAAASPMLVAVTRDALRRLARADGSGAGGERDLDEAGCRAVFERHREFFR